MSLTPVEEGGIYLMRVCGLHTPSSPIPGVGLGWLVPCTDSTALGGLSFTSADFRDYRTHGQRIRIDDLSALAGRFVDRISASVNTFDSRPGGEMNSPAADTAFASIFAVPTEDGLGSVEAPHTATIVAHTTPSS